YGPNLGPLVMSAAACRVPEKLVRADMWRVLAKAVRAPEDDDDGRLPIGDSKLVYSTTRGLGDLETSVLAVLALDPQASLAQFVDQFCLEHELHTEPWYHGQSRLPVQADADRYVSAGEIFRQAREKNDV